MLRNYNNLFLGLLAAILCGVPWWYDHQRLSGKLERIERQEVAVGKLLSSASIDWDEDGNPVSIDFSPTCTDQDLEDLGLFDTVRQVNLAYCFLISDNAIEHLTKMPNLQILYLYRNNPREPNDFINEYDLTTQPIITDKSLESIARIKSLQEVNLWDNEFSDEGILQLRSLPNLRVLGFRSRLISEAAIDELKQALPNTQIQN